MQASACINQSQSVSIVCCILGTNIDALQDAIITLSELLETQADYSGPVEGRIIESQTDPGRGKVATMLVTRGEPSFSHHVIKILRKTYFSILVWHDSDCMPCWDYCKA